jgi:hypothetical protein
MKNPKFPTYFLLSQIFLVSPQLIPVKQIPSTDLYTGIYYTISNKVGSPGSLIGLSNPDERKDGGEYLVSVVSDGNQTLSDFQWIFEPTSNPSKFILRNKKNTIIRTSGTHTFVRIENGTRILFRHPAVVSKSKR